MGQVVGSRHPGSPLSLGAKPPSCPASPLEIPLVLPLFFASSYCHSLVAHFFDPFYLLFLFQSWFCFFFKKGSIGKAR